MVRHFCSTQKLATITELVAQTEADATEALTSSSLEASVRQYGQEWDFRENLWKKQAPIRDWLLEGEPAQLAADLLGTSQIWLLRDQTYFKRLAVNERLGTKTPCLSRSAAAHF